MVLSGYNRDVDWCRDFSLRQYRLALGELGPTETGRVYLIPPNG